MIPRGGIDSQIDQRKAQFGANPQALQQRYGQSKDLLDLLALQQIAKEQEQKSQMMALQMQQNPATIANQLEQEVLQGKKADMAQSLQGMQAMRAPKRGQSETARGVAGALAQKQRQQQSNMQKVARSGVAAQPAKNLERMYDGGIVGFKAGGITDEEVQAERLRLKGRDKRLTDAQIRSRLETRRKIESLGTFDAEAWEARDEKIKAGRRDAARRKAIEAGVLEDKDESIDIAAAGIDVSGLEDIAPQRGRDESIDIAAEGIDVSGLEDIPQAFDTESGEFQSFLEEAAGGYGSTPPPKIGDERQALIDEISGVTSGGATPEDPSALPPTTMQVASAPPTTGGVPTPGTTPPTPPDPQKDRLSGIISALEESYQQQQTDLEKAREAHDAKYGGRSKGKKFLDRFIRAAQLQNQGRMRTSNRDALAGFLGGFATATGEERDAAQEGLEAIAERQRQLTQGQLGIATGLAGIERGEALTQLERDKLAQEGTQFGIATRMKEDHFSRGLAHEINKTRQQGEQFNEEIALKGKELVARILKEADQTRYQQESLAVQRDFNRIREAAFQANSEADRNRVVSDLTNNKTDQEKILRDEKDAALRALVLDPAYTSANDTDQAEMRAGIEKYYDTTIKGYNLSVDQLIKDLTGVTVPSVASSTPTTGDAVDFGSLPK